MIDWLVYKIPTLVWPLLGLPYWIIDFSGPLWYSSPLVSRNFQKEGLSMMHNMKVLLVKSCGGLFFVKQNLNAWLSLRNPAHYFKAHLCVVGSWVMWFISSWETITCLLSWVNDNYFHSKRQSRAILIENSLYFVNLVILASNYFFLSLRYITWLRSQHQKTRGHLDHLHHLIKMLTQFFTT